MDRRERETIMSEGPIRRDGLVDRREREALARDDNSLSGRPLRHRLRNFHLSADSYVASLGGPLPWMQRLRMIEDETEAHERALEQTWRELAHEASGEEFALRWLRIAEAWSFHGVNQLIERHNRNFPAEARLPMNPRTGDFVPINGKPYTREPLGAGWILERFPASADAALAA
jgi:hypothetical protein